MIPSSVPSDAALAVLHVIDTEYDAIADLAMRIETTQPDLAHHLLAELERAEVHSVADMPANVVTLNAVVEFVDEGSGAQRTIRLVMPGDADTAAGKISILTPIGAGLIGLSTGSEILWPDRDGHPRKLRIVRVTAP
ncbi:MAG: transcription elongation factor GreAB [Alphaproteobacteria bacterium HGW-Alphaproteobacteria-16]|nr:MAG: transcription elongation factor GreAB [Alphaproteobacteria bacterium HGW-Alphaproteobacteria-16]